jgi:Mrp family chromosome partitioning ATPase
MKEPATNRIVPEFSSALESAAITAPTVLAKRRVSGPENFFFRGPIASLFADLKASLSDQNSLVLQVTAAMPGEGTSTVARELAYMASSAPWCRVLVIDGSGGEGGQGAYFNLPFVPDTVQSLAERGSIEVVRLDLGDRAFDLASFAVGDTEAASEHEPALIRSLYDCLRQLYTLVIVDCPPVMTAPYAASLSEFSDGVLLVIEAERTRVPVVARAKEELESAGAIIRGVVMNRRKHYIPKFIYKRI